MRLAEVPSTGYRWRALPGAEVIREDFASDSATGIGGGGMRTFTIVAGEAAEELRFELIRDWLPEMPERTFCCHIEPALNP